MSREEQGVALKRGLDLSAPKAAPMMDEPELLLVNWTTPAFPGERPRSYTPRENAVMGRYRREFYCRHCDFRADNRKDSAIHAASEKHVVCEVFAAEIVPVDTHDDWTFWEDGDGVSYQDRFPEERS
ncbi:MAG: hypothetical protein ACRBBO_05910 [Cognatishimia sp.]